MPLNYDRVNVGWRPLTPEEQAINRAGINLVLKALGQTIKYPEPEEPQSVDGVFFNNKNAQEIYQMFLNSDFSSPSTYTAGLILIKTALGKNSINEEEATVLNDHLDRIKEEHKVSSDYNPDTDYREAQLPKQNR